MLVFPNRKYLNPYLESIHVDYSPEQVKPEDLQLILPEGFSILYRQPGSKGQTQYQYCIDKIAGTTCNTSWISARNNRIRKTGGDQRRMLCYPETPQSKNLLPYFLLRELRSLKYRELALK